MPNDPPTDRQDVAGVKHVKSYRIQNLGLPYAARKVHVYQNGGRLSSLVLQARIVEAVSF